MFLPVTLADNLNCPVVPQNADTKAAGNQVEMRFEAAGNYFQWLFQQNCMRLSSFTPFVCALGHFWLQQPWPWRGVPIGAGGRGGRHAGLSILGGLKFAFLGKVLLVV